MCVCVHAVCASDLLTCRFCSPERYGGGDPECIQTGLPETQLQAHSQSAQTDTGETRHTQTHTHTHTPCLNINTLAHRYTYVILKKHILFCVSFSVFWHVVFDPPLAYSIQCPYAKEN